MRWRELNKHNHTYLNNIVPLEIVRVGKYSYGPLNIRYFGADNERLVIGNYCSIAEDVHFILGGNHCINTISPYPFKVFRDHICKEESFSKGPIHVEDHAWIGHNALILSGVTIGKGAIVGAGSVVSKDIPPYCIAAGNPIRIIKKRFSDEIIDYLICFGQNIDFEKIPLASLYRDISCIEDLQSIISETFDSDTGNA
ncbi:MAG: hypothetical protein H6Q14_1162 [Bacteroidetes bacterium]|nr:hypothetical protein [Bacteroidota bacterium]